MEAGFFLTLELPRESGAFIRASTHSSRQTRCTGSTRCIHLLLNLFRRYGKRNPLNRLLTPKYKF